MNDVIPDKSPLTVDKEQGRPDVRRGGELTMSDGTGIAEVLLGLDGPRMPQVVDGPGVGDRH